MLVPLSWREMYCVNMIRIYYRLQILPNLHGRKTAAKSTWNWLQTAVKHCLKKSINTAMKRAIKHWLTERRLFSKRLSRHIQVELCRIHPMKYRGKRSTRRQCLCTQVHLFRRFRPCGDRDNLQISVIRSSSHVKRMLLQSLHEMKLGQAI